MPTLSLSPILDLDAAVPLRSLILVHRGQDLDVDAGEVERIGGLCLQVLLAARKTWESDLKTFRVVNASEPCLDAFRLTQAGPALGVPS